MSEIHQERLNTDLNSSSTLNQEFNPEVATQFNTASKTRIRTKKTMNKSVLILPAFFVLSFFGALGFLNSNFAVAQNDANGNVAGESNTESTITKPQITNTEVEGTRTYSLNPNNRVAFVMGGNVWVMNLDGTNKAQITTDGSEFNTYRNLAWKNSNELSYSNCYGGECAVHHFNLANDVQYPLLTIQSPMINVMKWSPDGVYLYMNYVKPNGTYETMKWEEGNRISVLRQYTPPAGANYTHDDQIDFSFSNNGEYVAVTNTFVKSTEIENVVIYDRNGKQISVISGNTSMPEFTADSSVFFSTDNKYYKGKIGSLQSEVVVDNFGAKDGDLSVDGSHLVFWQLSGNTPVTVYRNINTKETKELARNFKVESWVNESNILGYVVENYKGVHEYSIQKLATIDLNGNLSILEESNVSEFVVNAY